MLWSHDHCAAWLSSLGMDWAAHVIHRLELDGPNLLAACKGDKTSWAQTEGFEDLKTILSRAASGGSFDRDKARGRAKLRFDPPKDRQALHLDVTRVGAALTAAAEGYVESPWLCGEAAPASESSEDAVWDRLAAMLWGGFSGDALGMPVQWFYNPPQDIQHAFPGGVKGYEDPPEYHATNTVTAAFWNSDREGCRNVVGSSILHGKAHLWQTPHTHYHAGLRAGENTLTALLVQVLLRQLAETGQYDTTEWLHRYVMFMTTPGSHNDSYADCFHIQFFRNYANGVPIQKCAGEQNHSTAALGPFCSILPLVALAYTGGGSEARATEAIMAHISSTHRSARLHAAAKVYIRLLFDLLNGKALRPSIAAAAAEMGIDLPALAAMNLPDLEVATQCFGLSCYVHETFPLVLYLAYKYNEPNALKTALLANSNCGGNTTHRGIVLGALLGAAHGTTALPPDGELRCGLVAQSALSADIKACLQTLRTQP